MTCDVPLIPRPIAMLRLGMDSRRNAESWTPQTKKPVRLSMGRQHRERRTDKFPTSAEEKLLDSAQAALKLQQPIIRHRLQSPILPINTLHALHRFTIISTILHDVPFDGLPYRKSWLDTES